MEALISEYIVCVIEAGMTMFFCLFAAHDRLRVRIPVLTPWVMLLAVAGSAASIALSVLFDYLLPFSMDYSMISLPFWFITGYFCLRWATGEPPGGLLFILLLSVQVLHLCRSTTYLIYGLFFPALTDGTFRWADIFGFGLPSLTLSPLLSILCHKLYVKLRVLDLKEYMRLWMIPLFFILLYLMQTNLYPVGDFVLANGFRIMVCLCALVTYSQMTSAISHAAKAAHEAETHAQLAHQLDIQRTRVEDMERYADDMKRIRHDRRQHVQVLRGLLEQHQLEQALVYLDDYEGNMSAAIQPPLCENFVADTLCRRYETLAKQSGIDVTIGISLTAEPGVSGSDLAVILGNLWENALAAALDAAAPNRFIRLQVQTKSEQVLIRMENGYAGAVCQKDQHFLSTKPGRNKAEGVGITSIRAVAVKYGGMADFTYTPDVFTALILLYAAKQS